MDTKARPYSPLFPLTLAIAAFALFAAPASAAPFAYVPVSTGVSVVDTATNTVTTTIATAALASNIAITPDGKFVYVSEHVNSSSAGTVEVIATATNTVVANIPVGGGPSGIAVSPNGQSVYVCDASGSSVSVIATGTNSVVAQIPVGTQPSAIVFSPDGSSAWVANPFSNTVSVIDTATNTVTNTLSSVGSYPNRLAVAPTGSVVFVSGTQGVYAVDIVTRTVLATVPMSGGPIGLDVSPDGTRLYRVWSNIGGTFVSIIETSGYTVVTTIGARIVGNAGAVSVNPDGALLYLSYPNSVPYSVSVVSATGDNALVTSFSVPGFPGAVAFAPSSNAVIAPALITFHPASVAGGTSAIGYVVLSGGAPAGGAAVSLSSDDNAVTVPAVVTVPAGSKTASFNVTTQPGGASKSVNVTAVYNTLSKSAVLTVIPQAAVAVSSVAVNPTTVVGGNSATGTVTLAVPAPAGGVTVDLWTNGSPAFVPANVTIPAGSTTATFPVTTIYTATNTPDTITAFLSGTSATTAITVTLPPAVLSVSVNPTNVPGNGSATGTVTLTFPAPPGGAVVQLWTSGLLLTVPASVTVAAGSTTATFPVMTGNVSAATQGTITAFLNSTSITTSITVTPLAVASLSAFNPTLAGSSSTTGELRLNLPVTATTVIQLWTNGSPVFVPESVTITAGGQGIYFPVTTNYVTTATQGTITAYLNGQTTTLTINVTPIGLASVYAGPPIQNSGMGITGVVTLAGPAPQGGVVVQLWSNGSPALLDQTSVTIPFGSTWANFSVTADFVTSPKVGTITAFLKVASIKPADPAYTGRSVRMPPDDGMVTMRGWSLKDLIRFAWGNGIGFHPSLLSGGPSWIDHDRFDIVAKSDGQGIPSQDDRRQMRRTLLVERFQLKYHRESREIPIYALVAGKSGSKMRERKPDDGGAAFSLLMNGGFRLPGRDASMAQLADMLQSLIPLTDPERDDRPVVDRTGLSGRFDFDLTWAPDPALSGGRSGATQLTKAPDLFTALEDELGLKIEAQKAPMDVLVVDHAEKPSEN